MATGDYHHTALAVARGVGMVAPQGQVIIVQHKSEARPAGHSGKPSSLRSSRPQQNNLLPPTSEKFWHEHAQATHSVAFADQLTTSSNNEHQGLLFHIDNSDAMQDDAQQALRAIAQVSC